MATQAKYADTVFPPPLVEGGHTFGGIELVDVDGNTVMVRLCGTCSACSASQVTLKNYVESKLRELVTPELIVEEVR